MIQIIGLPSSYDMLTLRAETALKQADIVVAQSKRNATAQKIIANYNETHTLDEAFEAAEDFDALYRAGAAEVLGLAKDKSVVFAVIGDIYTNGFVQELCKHTELCYVDGADAVAEALLLAGQHLGAIVNYMVVEARELPLVPVNTSIALVVKAVDNAITAAEAKLVLAEHYGDFAQLVLVRNGTAEMIDLKMLDGVKEFGDGACLVLYAVPLMKKQRYGYSDLVNIMRILRGKDGCPWDGEQTHKTLRQYLLEEAYEVLDAIDADDMFALYDELGDVLLQVVFHAEIARQCGEFTDLDITTAICSKMINRHPHIFSDGEAKTADAVVAKWEEIKRKEKGNETFLSVLEDVPKTMGAMMRAYKLQKKAGAIGFDWNNALDAFEKVQEETEELRAELLAGDEDAIEAEAGDLLFAIINVLRKVRINPEVALTRTCEKFIGRFAYMEKFAGERLSGMTLEELDLLWNEAKETE